MYMNLTTLIVIGVLIWAAWGYVKAHEKLAGEVRALRMQMGPREGTAGVSMQPLEQANGLVKGLVRFLSAFST